MSNDVPTFGDIYRQNYLQSAAASTGVASSYQQQQSLQRGPIIEMPQTPNSTKKSSSNYKSTTINRKNGPLITPMSPTGSDVNLVTSSNLKQSSSRSRKQQFSTTYRQAQQYSQHHQQQQQELASKNSASQYSYNMYNSNRVPVVNLANSEQYLNDTEKRFVPINIHEQRQVSSSSYTDSNPHYRASGYQQQTTLFA